MIYSVLNFFNKHTIFKYNFLGPCIRRHKTGISFLADFFLQLVSAKESFFCRQGDMCQLLQTSCFHRGVVSYFQPVRCHS